MLKKGIFLAALLSTSLVFAQSLDYQKLTPQQPTQNPDKIEVIEFFWYGCPHCYSLEPELKDWLKTKPDKVDFIRQPVIFNKVWEQHAKAYLIAQALGVVEQVHSDFFEAIHSKKQKLGSEDELAEFFVAHGVDETQFRETFHSFLIDAQLRQAKAMAPRYGINAVPAIVINGKYKTSAALAGGNKNIIAVMNRLIQQESK